MKIVLLLFFFRAILFNTLFAKECDFKTPAKSFHPQYATHFSIDYFENYKILNVDKEKYLLSSTPNILCETSIPVIVTPIKKAAFMSTTYLPALELLQQEKTLIAFQGKRYIVSPSFNLNSIKEIAYKFNPEYLLSLQADLIMGYESNLSGLNQQKIFKTLKIPVVINKDFEEKNPLGRAEWLIFISSFYNQDVKAMKIFNSILESYEAIKKKNLKISPRPKVIVGDIQKGYWVTCGGESDLGQLILDAGGDLAYKSADSKTQEISLEKLSLKNNSFDVWLTHNMWASKKELTEAIKKDARYTLITAKNIYNNNLILNKEKSNDYWETALQRPDLLLLDLSAIFHPEEYKEHKLHWYRKL